MADEYFYGATLKGKKAIVLWNPTQADDSISMENDQKLIIKLVVVGTDAVQGELNVVEVEAPDYSHLPAKVPIAILKNGSINQVNVDISFPTPSVTFTLTEGSGPVHIIGLQLLGNEYTGEIDFSDRKDLSDSGDGSDDNMYVITNGNVK